MSEGTGLVHLAATLARSDAERFDEAFGEGAAARLLERVVPGAVDCPVTDEVEVFLREASTNGTTDAVLEQLVPRIDAAFVAPPPPADAAASAAPEASAPGAGLPAAPSRTAALDAADEPAATPPVLARTSRFVEVVAADAAVIGRSTDVDRLISLVGRARPSGALVVGASGTGRSTVLGALAQRLQDPAYKGPLAGATVVRVVAERLLLADTALSIRQIVEDAAAAEPRVVVAIDDLEVVGGFTAEGRANLAVFAALRAAVGLAEVPLLLLTDTLFAGRLAAVDPELQHELSTVRLEPLPREVLEEVVARASTAIAAHHGVTIPESVVRLALSPASREDTDGHPGLALARLDGAATLASLRADHVVADADLGLSDDPTVTPLDAEGLKAELAMRVMGQDDAIERIAGRLALTRARLDLRPDRPDGVFLFVGPTGVGKTELARATAEVLFGDVDRMLRLDMSEYAGEWAISQLIGPPPGYVGSTDPEAWLTTKIRRQPDTVLLLDEIEKADPRVWNTFLQVFDAGRLTDSHGRVADFSRVIVIMTSNLGAESFSAPRVGFGTGSANATESDRVLEQVRKAMAPELINRLDQLVVFHPLSPTSIREIAAKEVHDIVAKMAERGYRLTFDDAVLDHLATTGYSSAYGARHLQRNIEQLLLQPLAARQDRDLHASVAGDGITWDAIAEG